jgi:hypothetical protein
VTLRSSVTDIDEILRLTSIGGGEPRNGEYTGTKALMLAVLQNGIESYMGPLGRARTEAESWVNTEARRSPFSFAVVCETLGLEPDAARTALQRMRARGATGGASVGRIRPNVRQARQRSNGLGPG